MLGSVARSPVQRTAGALRCKQHFARSSPLSADLLSNHEVRTSSHISNDGELTPERERERERGCLHSCFMF